MTGALRLLREDVKERAPTRVVTTLGARVRTNHPRHVEVFDAAAAVTLRILPGRLQVAVPSLASTREVVLGPCAFGLLV